MLAGRKGRREGRRQEDRALHVDHEVGDRGRPDLLLDRLGADLGALVHVLVRPDVDDLVERADLAAPEAGDRRELHALGDSLGEGGIGLGDGAGLQEVGAHFEDHGSLLLAGGAALQCTVLIIISRLESRAPSYSAAARTGARNAGMTSFAKRSICSSVTASGVPSGMVQITRSSPG